MLVQIYGTYVKNVKGKPAKQPNIDLEQQIILT